MSVRRRGTRSSAFITALMVAFALVIPFAGTALAQHVSGIDVNPDTDTAPAGTCNNFTVTLTGPTSGNDTNPGVPGETIDVRITDTDADDNGATAGGANESGVIFCDPTAQAQGVEESGPNPATSQNRDNPNDDNPNPPNTSSTGSQPGDNTTDQLNGEVGVTDQNGQVTFGIRSDEAGNFSVLVFFDENNDDSPAGDFTSTATKTFGPGLQAGNEPVETLDCEPESDTNPEGTTHQFVCTATDVNNNRVPGATVTFDVTAGPNSEEINSQNCTGGTTGTGSTAVTSGGTTNSQGQIVCSYTDSEASDTQTTADTSPPGTDTILAFVQQTPPAGQQGTPNADAFEPQDTITKTFVGDANNIECTPDNGTAESGDIVTISCLVTDETGQPVPGVQVNFTETGAGTFRQPGTTQTQITDANGVATIEVQTGINEEGTITVTGTIVDRANDPNTAADETNDTNCQGTTGTAETGTNADCSDTATVVVTERDNRPPPPADPACSDGIDNDGDGRIDFPADEDCTDELDNAERDIGGRFNTTITIRYNRKARPPAFVGALASQRDECTEGRRVVLKKKRPGRDRVVGRDNSNRRGNWKIVKRRARGRFYAVVRGRTSTAASGATVVCNRDESVTITLRRGR